MKYLILLFIYFPCAAICQEIKTYSGQYSLNSDKRDGPRNTDYGKAVYKYFEDESSERIKSGSFSFQGNFVKIDGNFLNGLRTGLWKITCTNLRNGSGNILVVSAQYKEGKLNGKCSSVKTEYPSKKILEVSTATFLDNKLVGEYSYKRSMSDFGSPITIKYRQDSLGVLNGEYKADFYQECCESLGNVEDVIKFEYGNMVSRLCKEKVDGKVYYKYENGSYVKAINTSNDKDVFGSTWDAHIARDFWIGNDCQYCGTRANPLYYFTDGIDEVGFALFKERTNF